MTTTKRTSLKNYALLLLPTLQYIPQLFYGSKQRYNLGIFVERSTRIDFFIMHYANAVDFFVLGFCILYPKGIHQKVKELIFVIVSLDFFHLLLFAKQDFQMSKIGVAFLIVFYYEFLKAMKYLIGEIMALKLYTWLKLVGSGLWSLTVIDVVGEVKKGTLFDSVDGWIKTLTAVIGLIVLIAVLRNKIIEYKIKKQELIKLKNENKQKDVQA